KLRPMKRLRDCAASAERGTATCEGGEGMLPFAIISEEQVPFVDLEGAGGAVGTVELDEGQARVYSGWRIDPKVIEVDLPKQRSPAASSSVAVSCYRCAAPLSAELGTTGVVDCEYCGARNDLAHERTTCPSCGTSFESLGDGAEMAVCPNCSSQIDLRGAEPAPLGYLTQDNRPYVPFKLGQTGELKGVKWVITGHLRFQTKDAWGTYFSDEFLLFNEDSGYRWLILEDSHFSLAQEVQGGGPVIPHVQKATCQFNGKAYKTFEANQTAEVIWVDGQLPYVAQVGDRVRYSDAVHPPFMLSQETTERENEYFLAEYVPASEVAKGFGIADLTERQDTIAPNQPYGISPLRTALRRVAGFAALANVVLVLWGAIGFGQVGWSGSAGFNSGDENLSEPFQLEKTGGIYAIEFQSPVNNSWVYVEGALINAANEVVAEFGAPIEYYYGVEGGESWSEGSQQHTEYFKIDEAGEFRLLTRAEGPPQSTPTYSMEIRQGIRLARYNFLLLCITAAWWFMEAFRKRFFEAKRWGDLEEEDD
ncbi:MAG: DUF4178 domain-containing protein, partial [Myxococcota bacterium]